MTKELCDACGCDIAEAGSDGNRGWKVALKFFSFWVPEGDLRVIQLCARCGSIAARKLGFFYDTGKILSESRKEMIDGVSVCGPNGGGIADIAFGGVAGASPARWHAEEPDALPATCLDWRKQ